MQNNKKKFADTRRRHQVEALLIFFMYLFFGMILEATVIVCFLALGLAGLLDLKTIVSVTVSEVSIATVLYFLLGQGRRGRQEEVASQTELAEKFSHLQVYSFKVMLALHQFYYVENTISKQCYKAPKYIWQMADRGILTLTNCNDEEDMARIVLREHNCHAIHEREPTIIELLADFSPKPSERVKYVV